jgi:hypothetical protein
MSLRTLLLLNAVVVVCQVLCVTDTINSAASARSFLRVSRRLHVFEISKVCCTSQLYLIESPRDGGDSYVC